MSYMLSRVVIAGVPALSAALALTAASALAAPPDITRYCNKYAHPGTANSYPPTPDGRPHIQCVNAKGTNGAQGWRGPLVLVDFAAACKLTTGSEDVRYGDGWKIECAKGGQPIVKEGPGLHILQPEDLQKYCKHWIGDKAKFEYSASLNRAVCTGGSVLAPNPHSINLALACQTAYQTNKVRYVESGDQYYLACLK